MVKEPVMKCSQCEHNNTRSCIHGSNNSNINQINKGSLKLFGVRISTDREFESIKKSLSIGNLNSSSSSLVAEQLHVDGYLSDGPVHHARRKGKVWTETEHQLFLKGLEELGKGDWKGIANKFVVTRTAAQVASHAQKHFLRMTTSDHKKKRPSVFDAPLIKHPLLLPPPPPKLDTVGVGPEFVESKKSVKLCKQQGNQSIVTKNGSPTPTQIQTSKQGSNFIPISPHPTPITMSLAMHQQQGYVLLQSPSDHVGPSLHRYQTGPSAQPRVVVNREPSSKTRAPQDALELRLAPAMASPSPSSSGAIRVT